MKPKARLKAVLVQKTRSNAKGIRSFLSIFVVGGLLTGALIVSSCAPEPPCTLADPACESFQVIQFVRCLLGDPACAQNGSGGTGSSCTAIAACPSGYVKVPCNPVVGTTVDFCVAKYEMKNVSGTATSQAAGAPWVSIDQTNAKTQCSNLGAGYHLITNPEWMTLARDIETTAGNWNTGTVNSGNLARGWAANTSIAPVDPWQNTMVAPSSGAGCLYNTSSNVCAATGTHLYKRTHELSNGEVLWDISGNVWEWVDWNVVADKASPGTIFIEINTAGTTATMTSVAFKSTNTALTGTTHAIGRYYPGANGSGGAALRGGVWYNGSHAGVFTLNLGNAPSYTSTNVGFRCAYSP